MEMEFINQALKLTVQELTNKLVDETLAKESISDSIDGITGKGQRTGTLA